MLATISYYYYLLETSPLSVWTQLCSLLTSYQLGSRRCVCVCVSGRQSLDTELQNHSTTIKTKKLTLISLFPLISFFYSRIPYCIDLSCLHNLLHFLTVPQATTSLTLSNSTGSLLCSVCLNLGLFV